MIGWRGFVHLARRSKIQLTSELVYHADLFKPIKGSNRQLIHEPASMRVRSEVRTRLLSTRMSRRSGTG